MSSIFLVINEQLGIIEDYCTCRNAAVQSIDYRLKDVTKDFTYFIKEKKLTPLNFYKNSDEKL